MTPRGSLSWKMLHFLGSQAVWIAVSFKNDLGGKMPLHCMVFYRLQVKNSLCFIFSLGSWKKKEFTEPKMSLNSLCNWGWPWTPNVSTSTSPKYCDYKCTPQHGQLYYNTPCAVTLSYSLGETLWNISDLCCNWHPIQHHWTMASYTTSLSYSLEDVLHRSLSSALRYLTQNHWAMF